MESKMQTNDADIETVIVSGVIVLWLIAVAFTLSSAPQVSLPPATAYSQEATRLAALAATAVATVVDAPTAAEREAAVLTASETLQNLAQRATDTDQRELLGRWSIAWQYYAQQQPGQRTQVLAQLQMCKDANNKYLRRLEAE